MKHKILIVKREESLRVVLRDYLERAGYEVETCGEREQALALLEGQSFAMLLSDLHLTADRLSEGSLLVAEAQSRAPRTAALLLVDSQLDLQNIAASGCICLLNPPRLPVLRQAIAAQISTIQEPA